MTQTNSVVPKAAAEEQDTSISVNGSAKDPPMVDFDELTDLIRYGSVFRDVFGRVFREDWCR